MAILNLEYYSEALGMNRNVKVIYPESSKSPESSSDIPVLYLLHGMSGNENSWIQRSEIDRLVRHTNLAIVMPSTDLGFYTNTTYGMNYFDAIANELPEKIHYFLPNLSQKRKKNFIAGLSMGGYGAFKIALISDKFSYAASLSGALAFDEKLMKDDEKAYWTGIFGPLEQFNTSKNNLSNLMKPEQADKPRLYAWCGKQDYLFEANNYMIKKLKEADYNVKYETSDGIHEWYYWSKKIEAVLNWLPINYQQEERLF